MTQMLSVPLPDDLKTGLDRHKEIKWVEVARQALRDKVEALDEMDGFFSKSKVTEKDVEKHSRIVKAKVWRRYKKELGL
ncbi:MAG: hypothetical protein V1708_05800 [Candidatus Micrarchaeota archaeon]